MNKQKGGLIAIAGVVIAVVICILIIMGINRHSSDSSNSDVDSKVPTSSETAESDDTAASSNISDEDNTASSSLESDSESSTKIDYSSIEKTSTTTAEELEKATNLPEGYKDGLVEFCEVSDMAIAGYHYTKREDFLAKKTVFETRKEKIADYNLQPYLSEDGSQMLAFNGNSKIYLGEDGKKYIISGADVVEYDGTLNPFNSHMVLRKEDTSERIYLFDDPEKESEFLQEREDGAILLNGGNTDSDWKVVLNGQYLPNVTPTVLEDGQLYIPLRQIAEAYNPLYTYVDSSGDFLYLAYDWGYMKIPNSESSSTAKYSCSDITAPDGTEYWYSGNYGVGGVIETYGDYMLYPQTKEYFWVTPKTLGMILGWQTYINNNVISIVSDELDDSDLTATIETISEVYYDMAGNVVEQH